MYCLDSKAAWKSGAKSAMWSRYRRNQVVEGSPFTFPTDTIPESIPSCLFSQLSPWGIPSPLPINIFISPVSWGNFSLLATGISCLRGTEIPTPTGFLERRHLCSREWEVWCVGCISNSVVFLLPPLSSISADLAPFSDSPSPHGVKVATSVLPEILLGLSPGESRQHSLIPTAKPKPSFWLC